MKTIDSGARCCPSCSGTAFDKCTCDEDKTEMKGCNLRCCGCNWHGFALQLVVKPAAGQEEVN
jgi:hypothetical protein